MRCVHSIAPLLVFALGIQTGLAQIAAPGGPEAPPEAPAAAPAPASAGEAKRAVPAAEAAVAAAAEAGDNAPQAKAGNTAAKTQPRDPFWPIGYTPEVPIDQQALDAAAAAAEAARRAAEIDWRGAQRKIQATAFSRKGSRHYAFLRNHGLVEEGDIITVKHKVHVYKFRIGRINERGFSTERVDVQSVTP